MIPTNLPSKIDLSALVKEAMDRFNKLTPEQQREHRDAQRKSWVISEMMMSHPEMTREDVEAIYNRVVF